MAYMGTTSTSANPPNVAFSLMGSTVGGGFRYWVYNSTHLNGEITGANFFTDGQELGMTVGDVLINVPTGATDITAHRVNTVGSTTTQVGTGSTYATVA